jgi:4-hydroxybenzoate polyprenyltransferase
LIRLLRPRQWTKNLFVFAGLIFSQNLLRPGHLGRVAAAFGLFCLLSGCIYILNDLADLEQDRAHPVKRRRPLAAGQISPAAALAALAVLLPACLAGSWLLGEPFFYVALAYLALQVAYNLVLKRVVILDVFTVAAGFVLRVVAGAAVIDVQVSHWLLLCTTLIALFLALAKRRHELALIGEEAAGHRQVLSQYSLYFLDQMMGVTTSATVLSYALYTVAPETVAKFGTDALVYTVPFVLYGVFRYLYLIHVDPDGRAGGGGSPESALLNDRPLLVCLVLWVLAVWAVLYH